MPFQLLGLPTSLLRNVRSLGYTSPTPIQAQAIPVVRSGRDIVATLDPGGEADAVALLGGAAR